MRRSFQCGAARAVTARPCTWPFPRLRADKPFARVESDPTIKKALAQGTPTGVDDLGHVDLVVCGTVAVNRAGARIGKGGGYSDLELGLLIEAGLVDDATTVVTTVLPLQLLDEDLPETAHDPRVDIVVTPDDVIRTDARRRSPGIIWDHLDDDTTKPSRSWPHAGGASRRRPTRGSRCSACTPAGSSPFSGVQHPQRALSIAVSTRAIPARRERRTVAVVGRSRPAFARLPGASGPDRHPLQRQAHLRRDEPRRMVLVLRPNVPHNDDPPSRSTVQPACLAAASSADCCSPASKPSGNVTSNGSDPSGCPRLATRQP